MIQTYRTNEIAEIGQVHPNTVRVYEEWGYLSPVPRAANGYRIYGAVHVVQLKIARLAFRCELIQNNLRKRAKRIVILSGQQAFPEALLVAKEYFSHLQLEHQYALEAIEVSRIQIRDNRRGFTKLGKKWLEIDASLSETIIYITRLLRKRMGIKSYEKIFDIVINTMFYLSGV